MTATLAQIGQRALSHSWTLEATYDLARACIERGIAGDFVECGVFAGSQVAAMALAILESGATDRYIHLFDTFTGIPQAGEHDEEFLAAGKQPGESACSRSQVEENMREWGIPNDLLVYHEGMFQDTVPVAQIERIALLRLDGDLYESTKPCISTLLPKVTAGGWVIVDDYHLSGCRKAIHETVMPGPIYFQKS